MFVNISSFIMAVGLGILNTRIYSRRYETVSRNAYMMWEICIHNDNEVSWRMFNAVDVSRSWNDMNLSQAM